MYACAWKSFYLTATSTGRRLLLAKGVMSYKLDAIMTSDYYLNTFLPLFHIPVLRALAPLPRFVQILVPPSFFSFV
ncbi:hypothetical protein RO3G_03209 [Rhizopus delemar RA 99-880]|uniref:Uncharacterized protein n=1 Tax=Rhizopus delemar (strain RA 99-880 / ATCC MYA-4621 / FGSC 9543 / NRRL 43880) TaxID=246409 RepID=I1BQM5_RHIO9|nr:hypothetical protein RO3G_03209 [Rhizopus delemar RA 99-880]|eukprot:EIE78505.1 hypothetical protein RO3G_03209 [Rhizopus delemar RA 99-880]